MSVKTKTVGFAHIYWRVFMCGLLGPIFVAHAGFVVNNLQYSDPYENGSVKVIGVSGTPSRIIIPSSIKYQDQTHTVFAISYNAFYDCDFIKGIVIPDSVRYIQQNSFMGCDGLTHLTIPGSVDAIRNNAFNGCTGLTNVTIQTGVKNIEWDAFANCTSLGNVIIPNSVTQIGVYAFEKCYSLTNIVFEGVPPNTEDTSNSIFAGVSTCAIGVYKSEHRSEWKAALDVNNCWHGLKMVEFREIYHITYDANGGEGVVGDQIAEFGSDGVRANDGINLFREGYAFIGWSLSPNDDVTYYAGDIIAAPLSGDRLTLYAVWEVRSPSQDTIFCDGEYTFTGDVENKRIIVNGDDVITLYVQGSMCNVTIESRCPELCLVVDGDFIGEIFANSVSAVINNNFAGMIYCYDCAVDCAGRFYGPMPYAEYCEINAYGGCEYLDEYDGWWGAAYDAEEITIIVHEPPPLTLTAESADWLSGSITLCCTDGDTSGAAHTYSLFYEDESGNLVAVGGVDAVNVSADANGNAHLTDTAFSSRLDGIKPVKYHVKDENGRVSEACETRNRHAIFVGLNKWRNADLKSTGGDRDANNFFNIAALRGGFNNSDNIHVLLNSGAKADDVDDAFNRVAESVQTGDIFLFYFRTHGGYDKSDGTTFLFLYDEDYTDTALAKKIQGIEATGKSVAIIGVVAACHAGGMYGQMYDPDARLEHWCVTNGLARCSANIAWIAAADREHTSYAVFNKFLLDYGWEEGWAGNDTTLSFLDLATYTKDRYEALLGGIKSYRGWEVQIENPSLLGKVMAGTRGSHANKNPPAAVTGIKAETGDRVDEIKTQWNAVDNADEYWLFCETGGVNEVCAAYSCPARETEVIMSFQKLFGESEFDPSKLPIKYSVKAVNGAGVSVASTVEVQNFVRIVFDANGGGISGWRGALPHEGIVYADVTLGSILGGRLLTLPDAYGDSNKEFTGWFSNGTQADPRAPIVSDETYFAHWEAKNTHGMTQDWLDRHQTIATASNGDIATAAAMTAANGCRTVGECYALGIDPEDPNDDLKIADFKIEDGKPVITLNHTKDGSGNSFEPRIKTLGKANLTDADWVDVTDKDQSAYRFFKVTVDMP